MKPANPQGVKTNQCGQIAGVAGLHVDDGDGRERAGRHDDDDRGEHQRHFVADHLRDGAHRAEQRIFIAAGPAGHEDGEFHQRADGEEEKHAGIQIRQHHVAADGQHRVGKECRDDQQQRRQKVHHLVGGAGNDVFFGQRLDAVGNRLEKACRADTIGAVTILHSAQAFAFQNGRDGEQEGEYDHNGNDRQNDIRNGLEPCRQIADEAMLHNDKNLIGLLDGGKSFLARRRDTVCWPYLRWPVCVGGGRRRGGLGFGRCLGLGG